MNIIKKWRHEWGLNFRRFMNVPLQEFSLEHLHKAGFRPSLLLDVGASDGPFADEAWAVWPALKVHAFEPDIEYSRILEARAKTDSRLIPNQALLGAREQAAVTYYHNPGASTLFKENRLRSDKPVIEARGIERQCPMTTLDAYCQSKGLRPEFLKMDVQGYELEILRGAEQILPSIEVILTEVNHLEVYAGAPLAAELIGWLDQHGYALHDICNLNRRALDEALWQSDMIFVRHTSPLRAKKAWEALA